MFLSILLVLLGLIVLWSWFWRVWYRFPQKSDEVHFVETQDGWNLALSHYRGKEDKREYPVILCPGLASNRYSFDARSDLSLARTLAQQGYDVWTLELRGHGYSDRPALFGHRRFGFSFDDYLRFDLPAAIDYVKKASETEQIHWIGHSMGGILMLCHLGLQEGKDIRSATTIGSSLHFHKSESWYRYGLTLRPIAPLVPGVPLGWSHLFSPLAGRIPHNPMEEFLLHTSNSRKTDIRRIVCNTFHTVSTPVLLQMGTAFEPEGLSSVDRKIRYNENLTNIQRPVLMIAGDRDHQCTQQMVEDTFGVLETTPRLLKVFGKKQGQQESYGHFDLLMGERATSEVFPSILEWLAKHDRP